MKTKKQEAKQAAFIKMNRLGANWNGFDGFGGSWIDGVSQKRKALLKTYADKLHAVRPSLSPDFILSQVNLFQSTAARFDFHFNSEWPQWNDGTLSKAEYQACQFISLALCHDAFYHSEDAVIPLAYIEKYNLKNPFWNLWREIYSREDQTKWITTSWGTTDTRTIKSVYDEMFFEHCFLCIKGAMSCSSLSIETPTKKKRNAGRDEIDGRAAVTQNIIKAFENDCPGDLFQIDKTMSMEKRCEMLADVFKFPFAKDTKYRGKSAKQYFATFAPVIIEKLKNPFVSDGKQ